MNVIDAVILGFIQGVTEFFPVSSSAHLAITRQFLDVEIDLFFDVFLHLATVFVVLFYFRKRIVALSLRELSMLAVASIPAAAVGVLFKDTIESLFSTPIFIAGALFVTAGINFLTLYLLRHNKNSDTGWSFKSTFLVGCAQSLAVFPGITRLGSTLPAGLAQGVEKEKAFELSFLLMVPIALGAVGLKTLDVIQSSELATLDLSNYLIGGLIAFVVGLLSIRVFHWVLVQKRYIWVSMYSLLFALMVVTLISQSIKTGSDKEELHNSEGVSFQPMAQ